jgi:hypothetical protein
MTFTEPMIATFDLSVGNSPTPIMAEYTIDVIHSPREALEKLIDNCDAYIGVFHKKWGFVPEKNNPEKLSVTAIEYEKAKKRNIPKLTLIPNYEKEKELKDFIKKISTIDDGIWRVKYEDSNELILQVSRGMPHLVEAINSEHNILQVLKTSDRHSPSLQNSPPVYSNPVQLQGDSDLFICKLYQQVRHIMEEPRNALEIYRSLRIGGVGDQEQGTREVVQELRRKRTPQIARVVGTEWDVFLTEEGLGYCESKCTEHLDRVI